MSESESDYDCDLSKDKDSGTRKKKSPSKSTMPDSMNSSGHFQRQFSMTDFTCGCCFELMVQPTTLSCGHSFCRLCLARWYFQIKKLQCPLCKQIWNECSKVNVTLRNLIEKSFAEKIEERQQITSTPENAQLLDKFEKEANRQFQPQNKRATGFVQNNFNRNNGRDFCIGLLVMLGISVVGYIVWYWSIGGEDPLIYKPPLRWSEQEVCEWLNGMGSWAEPYCINAKNNQLNGRLLLALDLDSLRTMLNVTRTPHLKAMYSTLQTLKEQGLKLPSTLWEYKALNPKRSLFLLHGMKDFPRSLMLYLYFFEYEDIFLPFIHFTYPNTSQEEDFTFTNLFEKPDVSQLTEFAPLFVVLPYWSVLKLTYGWLDKHYWIARLIIVNCLLLTIIEAMTLRHFFKDTRNRWNMARDQLKKYFNSVLSTVVFMILWPIVPNFICDTFFYFTLFLSSFLKFDKVLKGN